MKVLTYHYPEIDLLGPADQMTGRQGVWISDKDPNGIKTVVAIYITEEQAQMLLNQFNPTTTTPCKPAK